MKTVSGVYRKGKVVLDREVDWAEGRRVTVRPVEEQIGLREEDWPDTPEAREELARRIATFEPVEFTPEEEAEIAAARAEVKKVTLAAVRRQMGLEP